MYGDAAARGQLNQKLYLTINIDLVRYLGDWGYSLARSHGMYVQYRLLSYPCQQLMPLSMILLYDVPYRT